MTITVEELGRHIERRRQALMDGTQEPDPHFARIAIRAIRDIEELYGSLG